MALSNLFYNTLVRRNSVFVTGIFASAFAFEMAFDQGMDKLWNYINRGRQWPEVKAKLEL
ncbi:MAG: cytochrome b-c1 complex subunit 9 [Piptocephalis tieghemiana]|nr:MAG: cytochrome b-c1 complex subunit 9 [Piptocephalis tieghemiana]